MVALVTLGFILGRTLSQRKGAETADAGALGPAVSQRIRDFRRVKVRDGRTVWELTADEAQYVEEEGKVLVTAPSVSFFGANGQSVKVSGREGRVFLNGSEIQKIELGGGIEVDLGGYRIETDEAMYLQQQDVIVAPGRVRVKGTELSLDGTGMMVDLGQQRAALLKGVRTTLHGAEGPGAEPAGGKPALEATSASVRDSAGAVGAAAN